MADLEGTKKNPDWVQDAAQEEARRRSRRRRTAWSHDKGRPTWRYRLWESYDAAQGWIVVTLIGACIGLNAAFLNIVTEWLSDIKMGYCTTAFYLNEHFCCMGEDDGGNSPPFPFCLIPGFSLLFFVGLSDANDLDYLNILGCDDWHRWTNFSLLNYMLYIFFAVGGHSNSDAYLPCHLPQRAQ